MVRAVFPAAWCVLFGREGIWFSLRPWRGCRMAALQLLLWKCPPRKDTVAAAVPATFRPGLSTATISAPPLGIGRAAAPFAYFCVVLLKIAPAQGYYTPAPANATSFGQSFFLNVALNTRPSLTHLRRGAGPTLSRAATRRV